MADAGVPDATPVPDATVPDATPPSERCNGIDDDGDGTIDDGFDIGASCEAGVGGCRVEAARICSDDGLTTVCPAVAGTPSAETCNGDDDDCDGLVDDDLGGEPCGSDVGACSSGSTVCVAGELHCVGSVDPIPELCNGVDDDCDGAVDDGNPGAGDTCDTGQPGVCAVGLDVCRDGALHCEPAEAPTPEMCNGDDDDCDGAVDDDCVPEAVTVHFPYSGARTGSLWAEGSIDSVVSPLRPTFGWSASGGATAYRLQVDGSCADDIASCDFASPEIDVLVAATRYTPVDPLPVSEHVPVGRRYAFRVSACTAAGCSPYSAVHYVDVGRVAGDLDGDGYPDLVIDGPSRYFVFPGGEGGIAAAPAKTVLSPTPGSSRDSSYAAGDLNGDGFDDVIVANTEVGREEYEGRIYVYLGGAGGFPAQPSQTVDSPVRDSYFFFGGSVAAGDLDGDGFGDVVIGAIGFGENGAAYAFRGGPGGIEVASNRLIENPFGAAGGFLGDTAVGVGDVSGDGLADVAIADSDRRIGTFEAGAVALYGGSFAGLPVTPSSVLENPDSWRHWFGGSIAAAGDVDGDGFGDLLTAPMTGYVGTPYPNRLLVYRGRPGGIEQVPAISLPNPVSSPTLAFASAIAGGDVDGDGLSDIAAGDWLRGAQQSGAAYLYRSGSGSSAPSQSFFPAVVRRDGHLGHSLALCDLDSDGHSDFVVAQLSYADTPVPTGAVFVFPGSRTGAATTPSVTLTSPPGSGVAIGTWPLCGR
jgi:hypothetical protein